MLRGYCHLSSCRDRGGDVKFEISSKSLGCFHVVSMGCINAQYIKKFRLESDTRVATASHDRVATLVGSPNPKILIDLLSVTLMATPCKPPKNFMS